LEQFVSSLIQLMVFFFSGLKPLLRSAHALLPHGFPCGICSLGSGPRPIAWLLHLLLLINILRLRLCQF
jgi:hypothetical protein